MTEQIGPSLPSNKDNSKLIGPALPPHLLNKSTSGLTTIGPTLPHNLLNTSDAIEEDDGPEPHKSTHLENSIYGPALPPSLISTVETHDDDDDDEVYGPLLPGVCPSTRASLALEERALQIKLGQLDSDNDKAKVREEWMMELPEVRSGSLGLGPRQFRKNARPDFADRSSWTDTPEQKAKKSQGKVETKIDLKKEAELLELHKRDHDQMKLTEKFNKKKKRDKSLLEIHQDEIKKKKKSEKEEVPVRRPFNREIDLKVNQFDDAQKKSILKKARLLDDRFSAGQSKFL